MIILDKLILKKMQKFQSISLYIPRNTNDIKNSYSMLDWQEKIEKIK